MRLSPPRRPIGSLESAAPLCNRVKTGTEACIRRRFAVQEHTRPSHFWRTNFESGLHGTNQLSVIEGSRGPKLCLLRPTTHGHYNMWQGARQQKERARTKQTQVYAPLCTAGLCSSGAEYASAAPSLVPFTVSPGNLVSPSPVTCTPPAQIKKMRSGG